jgi:DNA polymerase III epsilon subunit-like protein
MKPFTENIIFLDTEFSTLNPYEGEILSVGLVKSNGEELYLELEYDGPASDWVKENILPTLTSPKMSRDEAKKNIKEFVGSNMPYMVSYVNQYDTIYIYKLFQGDTHPFYWLPIDFASMMFATGLDPESQIADSFPGYRVHNALDDAKLLRDCYIKFFKNKATV